MHPYIQRNPEAKITGLFISDFYAFNHQFKRLGSEQMAYERYYIHRQTGVLHHGHR